MLQLGLYLNFRAAIAFVFYMWVIRIGTIVECTEMVMECIGAIVSRIKKQVIRIGTIMERIGTIRVGTIMESNGMIMERIAILMECKGTILQRSKSMRSVLEELRNVKTSMKCSEHWPPKF
jgi:hypothetical protein